MYTVYYKSWKFVLKLILLKRKRLNRAIKLLIPFPESVRPIKKRLGRTHLKSEQK